MFPCPLSTAKSEVIRAITVQDSPCFMMHGRGGVTTAQATFHCASRGGMGCKPHGAYSCNPYGQSLLQL